MMKSLVRCQAKRLDSERPDWGKREGRRTGHSGNV